MSPNDFFRRFAGLVADQVYSLQHRDFLGQRDSVRVSSPCIDEVIFVHPRESFFRFLHIFETEAGGLVNGHDM